MCINSYLIQPNLIEILLSVAEMSMIQKIQYGTNPKMLKNLQGPTLLI